VKQEGIFKRPEHTLQTGPEKASVVLEPLIAYLVWKENARPITVIVGSMDDITKPQSLATLAVTFASPNPHYGDCCADLFDSTSSCRGDRRDLRIKRA
jgi:hypothetical protein